MERRLLHAVPANARERVVREPFEPPARVGWLWHGRAAVANSSPGAYRPPVAWSGARSNELERLYLTAMQFQVNVKASLYVGGGRRSGRRGARPQPAHDELTPRSWAGPRVA